MSAPDAQATLTDKLAEAVLAVRTMQTKMDGTFESVLMRLGNLEKEVYAPGEDSLRSQIRLLQNGVQTLRAEMHEFRTFIKRIFAGLIVSAVISIFSAVFATHV